MSKIMTLEKLKQNEQKEDDSKIINLIEMVVNNNEVLKEKVEGYSYALDEQKKEYDKVCDQNIKYIKEIERIKDENQNMRTRRIYGDKKTETFFKKYAEKLTDERKLEIHKKYEKYIKRS